MQTAAHIPSRTHSLLDSCHRHILKQLQPRIGRLFENSNVAFLEFAEKAQTSGSQIRFMEALGVLQKERSGIEDTFYREIARDFSEFGSRPIENELRGGTGDMNTLSLLSKEDTDVEVAIQNMIGTASLGATLTLGAIMQRLTVLNHGRKLRETDIPGGPSSLAYAFHSAIKPVTLDHETRLLVYLLFDRFVLANTRVLYEDYNKLLLQAGILPYLKYEVQRNPASHKGTPVNFTSGNKPAEKNAGKSRSLSDELFSSVLQLIAARHTPESSRPERQVETGAVMSTRDIVSVIHQMQLSEQNEPVTPAVDPALPPLERQEQIVHSMLKRISTEREQLFHGIDRRRLPGADTQVIDLVGMMFEYMLRDNNLPSIAKAELCRLHTPYLKIAIADKTLFTDTGHPAHRLLNGLTSAGSRWVFENNPERGIFPCIQNIVRRIIEEFENAYNYELFNELQRILTSNLHMLENKADSIEERSRQAAAGREKLDQARNCAAIMIEELAKRYQPSSALRKVLGEVWLDKLMFIYLREPGANDSPGWKLAVSTLETILWSTTPPETEEARCVLQDQLPEIRRQTEQAFEMLSGYGTSDYSAQLTLIRQLQDMAVASREQSRASEMESTDTSPDSGQDCRVDTTEVAVEPEPCNTEPEEETILPTAAESAALDTLRRTAFGTWFRIQNDPQQLPQQLKLSWYSGISGNYMFVDSMGVRSLMIQHNELAALLVSGRAVVLEREEQPFIQRTLEMIRRMLGGGHRESFA